ncbi:MAG: hypothetical protein ACRCU3_08445 [Eubacteriaceae bacterium]
MKNNNFSDYIKLRRVRNAFSFSLPEEKQLEKLIRMDVGKETIQFLIDKIEKWERLSEEDVTVRDELYKWHSFISEISKNLEAEKNTEEINYWKSWEKISFSKFEVELAQKGAEEYLASQRNYLKSPSAVNEITNMKEITQEEMDLVKKILIDIPSWVDKEFQEISQKLDKENKVMGVNFINNGLIELQRRLCDKLNIEEINDMEKTSAKLFILSGITVWNKK